MGRGTSGPDQCPVACNSNELPEHDASIGSFYLDKFEVTLGRFRNFLDAYDGTLPSDGEGQHPLIAGSGWQSSFNDFVAGSVSEFSAELPCDTNSPPVHVWTDAPDGHEDRPMNCVRWYEAFAFCIWDGGRLPTEAEWEFVAAAGSENRLYPWGADSPLGRADYTTFSLPLPVGSYPNGAGSLGHMDLAGGLSEPVLDYFSDDWYNSTCTNCANLAPGTVGRIFRGGSILTGATDLRAAARGFASPEARLESAGFRCARDAPL